MAALAAHEWPAEAKDALTLVELLWGTDDLKQKTEKLEASPAVRRRRTTNLAITQRILLARVLAHLRTPTALRRARETLEQLLDDIDGGPRAADLATRRWRATTWAHWAAAVISSPPARPRRVREPTQAAAGLMTAIQTGAIAASAVPTVFAALDSEDVGRVAVQIALITRVGGLELPAGIEPMDYVDGDARGAIGRLIEEETDMPQTA
jgi:hypothetical protein